MQKLFYPTKDYPKEESMLKLKHFITYFQGKDQTEFNQKLRTFDPFNSDNSAKFFDPELMFGEEKFDIVIGNPPYIQLQKNGGFLANLYEKIGYKSFTRTGDIYCLFYEHAFELLREGGICTFITSNKWMRTGYGEKLREYLVQNTNPLMLVDLGPDVFETATVDSNILIGQKKKVDEFHLKGLDLVKEKNIRNIEKLHDRVIEIKDLSKEAWTILDSLQASIKKKMEKIGTPLKDWDINIYRGILTGYNEAFIIDSKKKNELIGQDPKSAEVIKPILRGRDIRKYEYEFADLYLIATHNGYKTTDGKKIEKIDIEDYPAVKDFLGTHRENTSKRGDKGTTPYNLRNCAYQEEFEKEKIVWSETAQEIKMTIVPSGFYLDKTCFMLVGKDLNYLTAIYNSKLLEYYARSQLSGLGEKGMSLKKEDMQKFNIPQTSDEQKKPFIELVDQILAKKKENPHADTNELEKKIDQMMYELYGLSDEEVKVVEESLG